MARLKWTARCAFPTRLGADRTAPNRVRTQRTALVDPAQKSVITPRMRLRPFTPDDAAELLALDLDPRVRRFVDDGRPVTIDEAARAIERWRSIASRHPACGCWAADDLETGRFLGWFHLFASDREPDRERELGYRLVVTAWGRGLATEGSLALITLAFEVAAIQRVAAETLAVHVASRRVMEKSGMRLRRAFRSEWPVRLPGDEQGDVEYEITRDMWSAVTPERPASRDTRRAAWRSTPPAAPVAPAESRPRGTRSGPDDSPVGLGERCSPTSPWPERAAPR